MNDEKIIEVTNNNIMTSVAMRGIVVFPKLVVHFDVAREQSVAAIKVAMAGDRKMFLVTQNDISTENPSLTDLYTVGVVAEIRQILKTPGNVIRVLVEGLYKAKMVKLYQREPHMICEIKRLEDSTVINVETTALVRSVKSIFEKYCAAIPKIPPEMLSPIMNEKDPYKLMENIVFNMNLHFEDKQQMLEASDINVQLGILFAILSREVEVLDIELQVHQQVKAQIEKGQKEYYLREQMKVISKQLGEDMSIQEEAYDYMDAIDALVVPDEVSDKLIKEAEKLLKMNPSSQESYIIKNYLDTCLELPWNTSSKDKLDVKRARTVLDKDHYGLIKVKERILETMAVRVLAPEIKGQIICLVGPPGVGKTSIGRSIAKALGRKYVRVSLGGVKDEADIRGHRKTYVGAMQGRIINALKTAGTNNPLMLLDEIDKMSNDFRGDPSSAMLEVLDSEQNVSFRDHYIELPFDLSKVMFVTTANTLSTIAPPLLDRMEVIELTSYTREEKFNIAKQHLISKQVKKHGLKGTNFKITDDGIYCLIDYYTKEAGVRSLERRVSSLCRKAAKELVEQQTQVKKVVFSASNIEKYLGPKRYLEDEISEHNEIGVVNGLAWTSVGGVIMPLEVLTFDGKGNIELTGSLGDVMKESARIAVSYVRSVSEKYGINPNFYKEKDIHVHAPEGAVPKDGPSAGVALTTALVSALSGMPVRSDVAMTGEITLHGKVLPIGGLKEKTLAAYKMGIKTVIIPSKNKADLMDIEDEIRNSMCFIFAETLLDVLDAAIVKDHVDLLQKQKEPVIPMVVQKNIPEIEMEIHS